MTRKNYNKMAENILLKMGVKFRATFIDHARYFEGDKERRDIYRVTFSRGGKRFSVRFGQSIYDSSRGIAPSAYDVLACLTKMDVGTFDDFCDDYGMDCDSRKAEKTYKAVVSEYKKASSLFTQSELSILEYIN